MVVGDFDQLVQRHTNGLALPNIEKRLEASINIFWKQADVFRKWAKSDITDHVAQELISKLPGMSDRMSERLFSRWQIERDDRGPTVWALYSALTYYSSHNDDTFPTRNTGEDHTAKTMHDREMRVRGWVSHNLFKSVAEHGRVIEQATSTSVT